MGQAGRFAGVLAGGIAAGVGVLGSVGGAQAQQASFEGIGFLLPGVQYPKSVARDVSGDGGTVVGYSAMTPSGGVQATTWTKDRGIKPIEPSATLFPYQANGVSFDGAVIVGTGVEWTDYAFRWKAEDGPVSLGTLPGYPDGSFGGAVSRDGGSAVGECVNLSSTISHIAFRWSQPSGMTPLPGLPDAPKSSAAAISMDGTVAVGVCTSPLSSKVFPIVWYDGEPAGLGTYPGAYNTGCRDVSDDGSVVLCTYSFPQIGGTLRWTPAGGYYEIEPIPGIKGSRGLAMTPDGAMIVGYMSTNDVKDGAFIWDAAHGMRSLRKLLTEAYGLDLGEWRLVEAQGISDDGTVIVGRRNDMSNGIVEGFIATIPPLCRPDCDTNGILDIDDFLCFQLRFAQGHVYADYNIDGILDIDDFLAFHLAFAQGC